jgi:kynureninase
VSSIDPRSLYEAPNALAAHYTRFRVSERLLLTGHSHQAWPDCAERGQLQAFADAAEYVERKWERAQARAAQVRTGFARLLDVDPGTISLGTSTHELVAKWLSALPLRERPKLVTTRSEFHSARRLLQRLQEEGIEVRWVDAQPSESVGERLADEVDDTVAGVITSTVFYDSAELAGGLELLSRRCERHGVPLLLDVYHHLNVVPLSLPRAGLVNAYVTGGGYKYCQLGEGNCFLRAPEDCALRPVITGWFAEFDTLTETARDRVAYGSLHTRFAGATYDPVSHYRAAEVFDFFERQGLTLPLLREVSQHQIALLRDHFDALDLPTDLIARRDRPLARLAGFLALDTPHAAELQRALAQRGVHCDARGHVLRLGPAPYLTDDQLKAAVAALAEAVQQL